MSEATTLYSFKEQFDKLYNYIILPLQEAKVFEEEEIWDNIYPMSNWTLEDHKMLWDNVDNKTLYYDIELEGFVFTELYLEEETRQEP